MQALKEMPIIIALKGKRRVGKSKIADYLVANHGFMRVHPFGGGKAATRGFLAHVGVDEKTAWEMTDGGMKDTPCELLPIITDPDHGEVGTHYPARFFMEKFAKCMGVDMGPEWTIGKELDLALLHGNAKGYILESIVWEAPQVRQRNGAIVEVLRNVGGQAEPAVGLETDPFSATITPDFIFDNSFPGLEEMHVAFDQFLWEEFRLASAAPQTEPAF